MRSKPRQVTTRDDQDKQQDKQELELSDAAQQNAKVQYSTGTTIGVGTGKAQPYSTDYLIWMTGTASPALSLMTLASKDVHMTDFNFPPLVCIAGSFVHYHYPSPANHTRNSGCESCLSADASAVSAEGSCIGTLLCSSAHQTRPLREAQSTLQTAITRAQ